MEPRDKRDLPEVIAEILIEQHAMRQDIGEMRQDIGEMRQDIGEMRQDINGLRQEMKEEISGLRQEVRTGLEGLAQTFNNMTNAILDAINRGNDRYYLTNERQDQAEKEVGDLKTRVTNLENPAA